MIEENKRLNELLDQCLEVLDRKQKMEEQLPELLKNENFLELLKIADKLRWQLSGFVCLYDETDPKANRVIDDYDNFLERNGLLGFRKEFEEE